MNIGKRKLLQGLTAILIGVSAAIGVSGCENHKDLQPIDVRQDTVFSSDYKDKVGYVMGLKAVYIVYGTYKGFHPGEAISPISKKVYMYSIRDLLDKYPVLATPAAEAAANKQGNIHIL